MQEKLSLSEKIDFLMDLVGVAPDLRARGRANYERLVREEGEAAFDQRIAKFEAIGSRLVEWRKTRGPAIKSLTVRDPLEPL